MNDPVTLASDRQPSFVCSNHILQRSIFRWYISTSENATCSTSGCKGHTTAAAAIRPSLVDVLKCSLGGHWTHSCSADCEVLSARCSAPRGQRNTQSAKLSERLGEASNNLFVLVLKNQRSQTPRSKRRQHVLWYQIGGGLECERARR